MYLCLLRSSATVKKDNGENMENARFAKMMTLLAGLIKWKTKNTSRRTEYDLKLIQNYFTYLYAYYDIIASYPISSYGFWKRSALTNIKKDALKYMINRLWYDICYITCHINPRPILALGFLANMGVSGSFNLCQHFKKYI